WERLRRHGATMRLERHKFQRASPQWSGRETAGARPRPPNELSDFANARSGYGVSPENPHVPLFAAGLALPATVALLVAVCRWPSQRLGKGAGRSNWSSTRATIWLTMSSTVCGWL